jgi:hypothetical protein
VTPTRNLISLWSGDNVAVDPAVTESSTLSAMIANPASPSALTTPNETVRFNAWLESTCSSPLLQVTADQPWLKFDTQTASTPDEVVITADPRIKPRLRSAGMDGAANSPLSIPVQLRIVGNLHKVHLPLVVRQMPLSSVVRGVGEEPRFSSPQRAELVSPCPLALAVLYCPSIDIHRH